MQAPVRIRRLGFVNAFLVREDDGLTLVDTTLQGGAKRILAAARAAGAPITRIALTHAHTDHVGSLDALMEEIPGAEVVIGARDARLLEKDRTLEPGEPQDRLRGGYSGTVTRPTRVLADGDLIGSLETIFTPGHTPGHVAYRDTRDGTIYCGDVFSTLGGVATTAKVNPRFPLPTFATWHRPTELESARKLRALDPPRLAPGHGPVVEAPGAAMQRAIDAAS